MATIYRNYKDNVFCLLYRDRANLPELYNGLNGTDYKDPEELTVVTLPKTVCIQYKNDAALTFSKDLYEKSEGKPELEIRAVMLNINRGYNQELMERCRTLKDYMRFVDKVRRSQETLGTEAAVRQAVEECIAEDILKKFFQEHKEEVVGMSIWEFNEELYREAMREDALEDGRNEGLRLGREEGLQQGLLRKLVELICRKLEKGKPTEQIAEELEESTEDLQPIIDTVKKFAPGYE